MGSKARSACALQGLVASLSWPQGGDIMGGVSSLSGQRRRRRRKKMRRERKFGIKRDVGMRRGWKKRETGGRKVVRIGLTKSEKKRREGEVGGDVTQQGTDVIRRLKSQRMEEGCGCRFLIG